MLLHIPGAQKEFVQAGLNLRRHFRLAPRSELQGSLAGVVVRSLHCAACGGTEVDFGQARLDFDHGFAIWLSLLLHCFAAVFDREIAVLRLGSRDSLGSEISLRES